MKVKVVLSNDGNDEVEFGPCNQGVVIENNHGHFELIDVASSDVIAGYVDGVGWCPDIEVNDGSYETLFIQGET